MTKNPIPKVKKSRHMRHDYWVWAILIVIICSAAAIRTRLLDVPLERDEGEYAYAGQLILQGVPPYAEVYNMKMPGIYAAYALILAAFGQTHTGIHLGLLVINTATILFVFLLARKLFNPFVGLTTAAAFALLSLGQFVQGIFANAEHFVILPAIAGILLLLRAVDCQKWLPLLAGAVLLGLAFLMKQHGAAFIIFAGLYLFFFELRRRPFNWKTFTAKGFLFLVGALLPFAVACLLLWRTGVFEKFWFWTFDYAFEYVSTFPLTEGLTALKVRITRIAASAVLVWILAAVGLIGLFLNSKARQWRLFAIGLLLFSFLAICPGFYFRSHYFILLLPAVALFAGIGAGCAYDIFARKRAAIAAKATPTLLVLIVLLHATYQQRNFFFSMRPRMASRATYGAQPFPESLEIARFIREHSTRQDRIAVVGSEPQIYFYSNRRAATGYIYAYPLMETHSYALNMQREMIREIEAARPKFLIFVGRRSSWVAQPSSEKLIFEWFQRYRDEYYREVGIIDIISLQQTVYRWGPESENYTPRSKALIVVFQRKKGNPHSELPPEANDADADN